MSNPGSRTQDQTQSAPVDDRVDGGPRRPRPDGSCANRPGSWRWRRCWY